MKRAVIALRVILGVILLAAASLCLIAEGLGIAIAADLLFTALLIFLAVSGIVVMGFLVHFRFVRGHCKS